MLVYSERNGRRKAIGVAVPRTRVSTGKKRKGKPVNEATPIDKKALKGESHQTVIGHCSPIGAKPVRNAKEKDDSPARGIGESQKERAALNGQDATKSHKLGEEAVKKRSKKKDFNQHPRKGELSPSPTRNAAFDQLLSTKLDDVLTAIDDGTFSGYERDLRIELISPTDPELAALSEDPQRPNHASGKNQATRPLHLPVLPWRKRLNPFAKAQLYANAHLPSNLPSTKLYLPAWPLVCLAAQYSEHAYQKPSISASDATHRAIRIDASHRTGTKAAIVNSVPLDHMNIIVLAIRGTDSFMDWAVNLRADPASPAKFLDDEGNFCHAGFLNVARRMVHPVAERLQQLLHERPERRSCSLVMTGHSAGGAVCSLLFCHMLAATVNSELVDLVQCFRRIHCITFGAPPVSGLPLGKPDAANERKSLFLSFINEGDPVSRADPPYVRALLDLYMAPSPKPLPLQDTDAAPTKMGGQWGIFRSSKAKNPAETKPRMCEPVWTIPPCAFSNAGKIIVLRQGSKMKADKVTAVTATDGMLREIVFGDPLMHMMKVYRERVNILASRAITGGAWEE